MRNVYANTSVGVDIDKHTSHRTANGNFPNKLEQTIQIDTMNESTTLVTLLNFAQETS